MNNECKVQAGSTLAAALTLAAMAVGQSGGLYLPENGTPTSGTAQAGSAAMARNAETAWLNPAGMTRLDSPEIMVGLMPFALGFSFRPDAETNAGGSDGGDQGGWLMAASMFAAVPVGKELALGLSVVPHSGLVLDPSDDWVGRSFTTESKLAVIDIEPALGVRVSDSLSFGAGLDVQYVAFKQTLSSQVGAIPVGIDGDSWNVGFSASALWEPLESTRFGLRYRSEVAHDLSGDVVLVDTGSRASTSFTLPMSLTLSGYHDVNRSFALMADVGWTDWSAFERNVITLDPSGLSAELPRDFQDVWSVSLGTHIRPADGWLLMLGGGYVSSAVADDKRTPDLPVDQQVRLSTGVEFELDAHWTIGSNYTFVWLGDNQVDQAVIASRRISGDYDAFAHVFGIYGNFSF